MIIGITGKKRSGKDTIGEYLVQEYGFERRSFADLLKSFVNIAYGITPNLNKEFVIEEYGKSVRNLYQEVGLYMRNYDPNIWVRPVMRDIEGKNIVVTDVRFGNEADQVDILWGVTRTTGLYDTHISETGIPIAKATRVFSNNGTISELYAKVRGEIKEMEGVRAWI